MTQIKLGYDRVPVPFIVSQQPLYDIIRGVPLRDSNNNPIVTEAEIPLPSLANAANATSVFISNENNSPVTIQENFPEVSKVSSSLLGIPRAETQLSLFADVSTYGLNPDDFEFYSFNSGSNSPRGWYTRENPVYGNRYYPRLREAVEEQALAIEAFPVNYNFARGPRFEDYDEISYERFVKFVQLGNQYFENYKTNYETFARENFLDPSEVTVQNGEVIYLTEENRGYDAIERWTLAWIDIRDGNLDNPIDPGNPILFFEGFGSDTTRPGTGSGGTNFGLLQSRESFRYQPGRISGFTFGFRCSADDSSVDNIIEWGIGNPYDQYVFQVRGASFSIVRRSTVALPDSVVQNQGLNPEDQKLVQSNEPISDTEFYELVIPRENFNADTLDGNGPSEYLLDPEKVTMYKIEFGWYGAVGAKFYAYIPTGTGGARWVLIHRLVIENQIGEPCLQDPNFQFRYTLSIQDRSNLKRPQFLYKYGASCYIDGGDEGNSQIYSYNSEENTANTTAFTPLLGIYPKDTLTNSEGKDKSNKKSIYPSSLRAQTDQLTEMQMVEVEGCPAFGHHYSPSLHARQTGIYRGIEVVNNGNSVSVVEDPEIGISDISNSSPAVVTVSEEHGYFTGQKTFIANVNGMTEVNNTEYYVVVLSDNTFALYADSSREQPVDSSQFSAYQSGGSATGIPIFLLEHDDAKIINRGLFGSYLIYNSELQADIARLTSQYTKVSTKSLPNEINVGEITELNQLDLSNVRFTNYDAIAATDYPLNGDFFDVNFLNPTVRDSDGQFAEFLIGISERKPQLKQEETLTGGISEEIVLVDRDGVTEYEPEIDSYLFEEFTQQGVFRDRDGYETGEDINGRGVKMDIDYRLPSPKGEDSGRCSGVRFRIEPRIDFAVSYSSSNPATTDPGNFVVFENKPNQLLGDVQVEGGEFGVGSTEANASNSGIRFLSNVEEYVVDSLTGELGYFAEIDSPTASNEFTLWLSPVTISDKTQIQIADDLKRISKRRIFSFQPKPFYLIIHMRDNAKLNNVTITEFFPDGKNSFCPEWIVNNRLDVVTSGGSQTGLPAANFESNGGLEASSIDTSLNQPLRPGTVKDTLYIAPNQNNEISLENVYGTDRTTISAGLLNTRATFFQAKSIEDNSLNLINLNVITKEQK